MSTSENIEFFFLKNLLRISLTGVSIILLTDLILYPSDTLSIGLDLAILSACIISSLLKRKSYITSVLILTVITLAAMLYQCVAEPFNTTTSMSIILIVGFIHSILLSGRLAWTLHIVTCTLIIAIFTLQANASVMELSIPKYEVVTIAITYLVLYIILSAASQKLKKLYDDVNLKLRNANEDLHQKANEIEAQNEELIQSQENLNELNRNLERIVSERTAMIQSQNELLKTYTYKNAHHLRGPVARLLGLISIHRLEDKPDYHSYFNKIEDQAKEIDAVVKQINHELGSSHNID